MQNKRSKNYTKKNKSKKINFSVINPNAAGIDIGSLAHYVSVPDDRDENPIKRFECFTPDLQKMVIWLKQCGIETIAMESTGVYWIPAFQILEKNGFVVNLVNARHVKNVPGRKTDVQDCKWLQRLHTFGLLKGSFRPSDDIVVLRSYIRHRDILIKETVVHINRMQKAFTQMNLQLHKVISDITGVTGIRIIKSILSGERNPLKLATLKDPRIKSSEATIAKALTGDYRKEHLFVLKQEYELYKNILSKIEECDQEIENHFNTFEDKVDIEEKPLKKKRKSKRPIEPKINLADHLYRITGIDFTTINGIDVLTTQVIVSEIGLDASKWPTEKHFSSWLGLSPNNKISGDKVLTSKTKKVVNRASTAFRQAAQSLSHSNSALGGYYRRVRYRLGAPKAITATAHKIACIFYRMLRYGQDYVDIGLEEYERRFKEKTIRNLERRAKQFGYNLIKSPI